jgi:uncharacterized cupin superfamily protein
VLDGEAELHIGARVHQLSAGHFGCFPAGRRPGHSISNVSDRTFRYLMIGTSDPDEIVVFTETGEVALRSLGLRLPMGGPCATGRP